MPNASLSKVYPGDCVWNEQAYRTINHATDGTGK